MADQFKASKKKSIDRINQKYCRLLPERERERERERQPNS